MTRLVVMGVAGCGKSVLARRLAEALDCPMLEGDDFHLAGSKEKMRTGIALDDRDRDPWLHRLGERLAESDASVVLSCSALKRRYRDHLRAFVPALRFVYIEIDVQTAARRVGARSGHLFPISLVTSQFAALESPVGEEGVCAVSALQSTEAQAATVAAWLASSPVQDEHPETTRSLN